MAAETTSTTDSAEPSGYYTSKYSGEEIDALLDQISALAQAVNTLAAASGVSLP